MQVERVAAEDAAQRDNDEEQTARALEPPKTWEDVSVRYEFKCPSPLFVLEEQKTVSAAGHTFVIEGSTMRLQEPLYRDKIIIGVVSAPKDASAETVANLRHAQRAFKKAGVNVVLVNGDLSEDEELEDVFSMIGERFPEPVFLHSGNIEWAASFNAAYLAAAERFPQLHNMNWVRHVQLGTFHLLSMPGYFNGHFLRSGACRYDDDDVAALKPLAEQIRDAGDVAILTAHGPPKSKGKGGIDVAFDAGNVGDPALTQLIEEAGIRFGIFGHILEAGGRATDDLSTGHVVKRPQRKPTERLYINAGSASGYGWSLLNGRESKGMAAIVTLTTAGGKVRFIKL